MPFIHLYRKGESDSEGIHRDTPRVTVFQNGDERFADGKPCIVLGTLPHVEVVKLDEVRWFWIERE